MNNAVWVLLALSFGVAIVACVGACAYAILNRDPNDGYEPYPWYFWQDKLYDWGLYVSVGFGIVAMLLLIVG